MFGCAPDSAFHLIANSSFQFSYALNMRLYIRILNVALKYWENSWTIPWKIVIKYTTEKWKYGLSRKLTTPQGGAFGEEMGVVKAHQVGTSFDFHSCLFCSSFKIVSKSHINHTIKNYNGNLRIFFENAAKMEFQMGE